ncbi:hypothetical protein DI53_1767 [Sphingobacterium deserti]|uniref:Uncharacterized protein n=1 Tax=Sphingobacterium deserti TaxID=1229276 RepID=A0A0B8T4I5_9SPHI|nr:hypothetical protein DI53_1767 [Sphingobacterium deserti]
MKCHTQTATLLIQCIVKNYTKGELYDIEIITTLQYYKQGLEYFVLNYFLSTH